MFKKGDKVICVYGSHGDTLWLFRPRHGEIYTVAEDEGYLNNDENRGRRGMVILEEGISMWSIHRFAKVNSIVMPVWWYKLKAKIRCVMESWVS